MARSAELMLWGSPSPSAVVLVLPGGFVRGRSRYLRFVEWEIRDLCEQVADRGRDADVAVYLLRYRCRGWNGNRADTAVDARWALAQIRARHGHVPVAVVGNSLGGRAAFNVAGESDVVAVVGVAPWLPAGEPTAQLTGRKVLILHGARDRTAASAKLSLEYAMRARTVVPDLARLEVADAGHMLIGRAQDCWNVTSDFVWGALFDGFALPPELAEAMAAPAPEGLQRELASAAAGGPGGIR